MRISTTAPAMAARRNVFTAFLLFVLALIFVYLASEAIIEDDMSQLAMVALGVLGAACVVMIMRDWRRGLYAFLGWLCIEDLARKFLGNNMAIYFAKDFLVLVVYLSFFAAWRRERFRMFRPPFLVPLLLLVWLGLIQILNPSSSHIAFGLLGAKLFFYYIPLLWVGYNLLDSEAQLRRFFFANCIGAIFVAGLGTAQSIIGPSFLNPGKLQEDIRELSTLYREAPISGVLVYRPNSVFVSNGRYVDFLLLEWIVVLGFIGYLLLRHRKGRILAFVTAAVVAGGIILSASRGVFMWSGGSILVIGAAFLWGAPWKQREVMRVIRALQRALLAIGLGIILLLVAYPRAILGRFAVYSETLSPDSPASELLYRVRDYPMKNFMTAFDQPQWLYGHGIGTTALGIQYITRFFRVRSQVSGVESGFGTIVVELGILGLAFWLLLAIAILVSGWAIIRKLKGGPWFPLGFVIWWYAFLLLLPITFVGMQPYEDFILNAYLWLLLGVMFRLPSLALSAQYAVSAPIDPAMSQRRIA